MTPKDANIRGILDNDSPFVRGMILKVLHAAHPRWLSDLKLYKALDKLRCNPSAEQFSSELVYLRDWPDLGRGYVELRVERVAGGDQVIPMSRITPRGINLVERLSDADPAVDLKMEL